MDKSHGPISSTVKRSEIDVRGEIDNLLRPGAGRDFYFLVTLGVSLI